MHIIGLIMALQYMYTISYVWTHIVLVITAAEDILFIYLFIFCNFQRKKKTWLYKKKQNNKTKKLRIA